ncbi:MAG TPA: right-handed parallel beta-helix repeat-containing protein [Pirellulales bacterium]|jgi:hypothetical protein|nr:right-handed parallel beta-helix repeat-containing protein [Pirellulales bacterium]
MRCLILAVAAATGLYALPAAGRDIFVNNRAGDDHFDGRFATQGGSAGPVQSLAKALRLADSGDRIIVANTGVPYHESVSLSGPRHSGFSFKPLVIDGNGATLDGSAPAGGWRSAGGNVFRMRPTHMAFGMLFLQGQPLARVAATPAEEMPPLLKPLEWTLHDGWIYFCVEPGRLPQQYSLSYAQLQVGLTLYKVEQLVITNLVVQGFELDGINCQDVGSGTTLDHITARWNGRSGIAVCGASHATLDGCLVEGNGQSQLHIEGPSVTSAVGCELIPKSAPNWLIHGGRLLIDGREVGE